MEIEFQSAQELYQRILPALRTKKREANRCGYSYITEIDIWNYLKENKWKKGKNLELSDMINDILNLDFAYIDLSLKERFQKETRPINLEG